MGSGKTNIGTDPAWALFWNGDEDIVSMAILIKSNEKNQTKKFEKICYHASQAVEKWLKGFADENGREYQKIHNLDKLINNAIEIDPLFKKIEGDCYFLDSFQSELRYSLPNSVTEEDVKKAIDAVERIRDFEPIVFIREKYRQSVPGFVDISEINLKEIFYGTGVEDVRCIKHDLFSEGIFSSLIKDKICEGSLSTLKDSEGEPYFTYRYNQPGGGKRFVLEKQFLNGGCEFWQFDKTYNEKSLKEFIRQWKIEENSVGLAFKHKNSPCL